MTRRNLSSFLPLLYISLVVFSVFLIHLSEMANKYRYQQEMKAMESKIQKKKPSKKKKKISAKVIPARSDSSQNTLVEKKSNIDSIKPIQREKSDVDFFLDLFDKYKSNRKEMQSGEPARSDLVIRYYKKAKDDSKVYKLRELGFYIHERPAETEFYDYSSNAIFYGDSVKKEDLIMIAYHLMNNGIELKSMTLSKYHDAWKAHSVEIGTDTTVLNQPSFTLATLRKKWKDM